MKYLSVCSGIEAASVAWHRLGWQPVGFSEIEPFPSAVLAHRFPSVPNFGDMTNYEAWPIESGSIDVLVGGTPCQSFSVAGLRTGLADPRGGLMLTYLEIAQRLRPRWVVWENVPGVLSSNGGQDFGSFLGAFGELGYGWAYRVLDAQWCRTHGHPRAVPQRRRRVFVVGCLGDPVRAAQVLFERESVQRDSATRRAKGQGAADDAEGGAGANCITSHNVAPCLETTCHDYSRADGFTMVGQPFGFRWQNDRDGLVQDGTAPACRASAGSSGFHEMNHPVVVQPFTKAKRAQSTTDDESWVDGQVNPTLSLFDQGDTRATTVAVGFTMVGQPVAGTLGNRGLWSHTELDGHGAYVPVAFGIYGGNKRQDRPEGGFYVREEDTARTLDAAKGLNPTCSQGGTAITQPVMQAMTVRRLTPRECERLQGFPDDWTLIPWRGKAADQCPDGPRYKALGNSMAVNCMEWIGERIVEVSK